MNTQNINNSENQNRVNNSKPSFYSKRLFIARATAMMKYKEGMTRSEAFKKTWEIVMLYQRLLTGEAVSFIYIMKNGRYCKATARMTDTLRVENPNWKANELTFPYFDVNCNGIRSFICANFVKCC